MENSVTLSFPDLIDHKVLIFIPIKPRSIFMAQIVFACSSVRNYPTVFRLTASQDHSFLGWLITSNTVRLNALFQLFFFRLRSASIGYELARLLVFPGAPSGHPVMTGSEME